VGRIKEEKTEEKEKDKTEKKEDENMVHRRHRVTFYVGKGHRRRKKSFLAR
jgi:hypothetical protein